MTSSRGYALLIEYDGALVVKACLLNLAVMPKPASNLCPAGAQGVATYTYIQVSGQHRLASATDGGGAASAFTYGSGTTGFVRPGETGPWLTNSAFTIMDEEGLTSEIIVAQAFADGSTYAYAYDHTPAVPNQQQKIAGGSYTDALGNTTLLRYDFPILPHQGGGGTLPGDDQGAQPNVYQVTPGPAEIVDPLGRTARVDYCDANAMANLLPGAANVGRFQYTSQIWLPELGMYHYKARVYSPTLGRFLQIDPIGYDDHFNLYAYVSNDPVNHADPYGTETYGITRQGLEGMAADAREHPLSPAEAAILGAIINFVPPTGPALRISEWVAEATGGSSGPGPSQGVPTPRAGAARGAAGGERAGRNFTPRGRETIDSRNIERHGRPTCEKCREAVVPGRRHERGVTPPGNERNRDHIIPRARGGDGTPQNGEVLCRDCNLKKRDRMPE